MKRLLPHVIQRGASFFVCPAFPRSLTVSTTLLVKQQAQIQAPLHTSAYLARKKKQIKPINVNPKGFKAKNAKVVAVWKNMTVSELAEALGKSVDEVFEVFLYVESSEGYDSPSSRIDNIKVIQDAVKVVGQRFVIKPPEVPEISKDVDVVRRPPPLPSELVSRPPVVTIMGHVDHGKTTLLDALRHSSIVESEFGGITQHIGAFSVRLPSGSEVTFLDTPGHAAFSAMRARGAHVTDIVVLVVAADDGVMEQTRESITHALEAEVPIIVAINKIDRPEADIIRCKEMLLASGLQLESQGGDVQAIEISALKGTNIDLLVEAIVAQAEVLNIGADVRGFVEGTIIESQLDPGRGKVATCIVQRGTLRKGSVLVAGLAWGKVRNLFSDVGLPIKEATPGSPVQVIGWKELPSAGDEVLEVESEKLAKAVVEWRAQQKRVEKDKKDLLAIHSKLEDHLKTYRAQLEEKRKMGIRWTRWKGRPPLQKEIKEDKTIRASVVLKADVDGSLDAILDVLDTYHSEECELDVIHYGVGSVTENDILMAAAFKGVVYTFNTSIPSAVRSLAAEKGTPLSEHKIIYRLIEAIKEQVSEKLPLKEEEEVLGEANVLEEFVVSEGKQKIPVAGCRCIRGNLKKDASFKLIRGSEVIYMGQQMLSMRHFKNEVGTVKMDTECGLRFKDSTLRFQSGDKIMCYKTIMVKQQTDWDPGF